MLDSIEEFGQIHIDTMPVSRADMMLDLLYRSVRRAFRSEAEAGFAKVRIEQRR